jgi:hypothetical protein
MYDAQGDINNALYDNDLLLGTRVEITPWMYELVVVGNQIQCLQSRTIVPNGSNDNLNPTAIVAGSSLLWPAVINAYGVLRPGISQIRLDQEDGTTIVGTVVINPNDDRLLIYDIDQDTAPQNTLAPITAIIDPLISGPNYGLPAPAVGQRYLLTEATGSNDVAYTTTAGNFVVGTRYTISYVGTTNFISIGAGANAVGISFYATGVGTGDGAATYAGQNLYPPEAWLGSSGQPLVAAANDVIEWTGSYWRIVFNSVAQVSTTQYVTNITTGVQYEWNNGMWVKSYQGVYPGGTWTLVL